MKNDSSLSPENVQYLPSNTESTRGVAYRAQLGRNLRGINLANAFWFLSLPSSIKFEMNPYLLPPEATVVIEDRSTRRISLRQAYRLAMKSHHDYEAAWNSYLKKEMQEFFID